MLSHPSPLKLLKPELLSQLTTLKQTTPRLSFLVVLLEPVPKLRLSLLSCQVKLEAHSQRLQPLWLAVRMLKKPSTQLNVSTKRSIRRLHRRASTLLRSSLRLLTPTLMRWWVNITLRVSLHHQLLVKRLHPNAFFFLEPLWMNLQPLPSRSMRLMLRMLRTLRLQWLKETLHPLLHLTLPLPRIPRRGLSNALNPNLKLRSRSIRILSVRTSPILKAKLMQKSPSKVLIVFAMRLIVGLRKRLPRLRRQLRR